MVPSFTTRPATAADVDAVLTFWRAAAEDTNRSDTRFAALGAHRVDAMVLADNDLAQQLWAAAGYECQPEWSRWVKFLPGDDAGS